MRPKRKRVISTKHRGYLRAGKQTKLGLPVLKFAQRFPGKNLASVELIVKELANLKRKKLDPEKISQYYSKRSASEVLKDGFVVIDKTMATKLPRGRVMGCVDYHIVLCAVLRAKGIPARFVRVKDHSVVHFFLNNNWYEADVNKALTVRKADALGMRNGYSSAGFKIPDPVRKLNPEEYEKEKKEGTYAHGLDAWAIGIKGIRDYSKFIKK